MNAWDCPGCQRPSVHSIFEFRRVYEWRRLVDYRGTARALAEYDIMPGPRQDAEGLVKAWIRGELDDAPQYVCVRCVTPFSGREVPV
jgi:hypothetical protein